MASGGRPEPDAQQRIESVWRVRADRLARRPVGEEILHGGRQVMVLGIGNERYGIDFPEVAEILPPVQVTPVPGVAAVFAGVVNVRGEVRPVVDLRTLLGIGGGTGNGTLSRVILLRREGREMGLRVDTVEQIEWIRDAEFTATDDAGLPRGLDEDVTPRSRWSKYIARSTGNLLMLLSTEALFAELDGGVAT
jgi:purine-binding chemotaxis protein CheW